MAISITKQEKQILQKVSIPPRHEVLLKISEEAKKPEADLTVIAEIISGDISISASVLQLVNSAAFRRSRKIDSIQQAVMTLGLKRLLPLVKAVALKSAMGESDKLADFWSQAANVAGACSLAASALGKPALQDHAYMLGLFHNAGILVMLIEFDDYGDMVSQAEEMGWQSIGQDELQNYGTSFTSISAVLAQKWKLPAVMMEVIYYQQEVEGLFQSGELSDLGLDLLSILKLARYSVWCLKHNTIKSAEWDLVQDDVLQRFNLSEEDLDNIREHLLETLIS